MGMHNGRRSVETRVRAREEEKKTLLGEGRGSMIPWKYTVLSHMQKRGGKSR